MKTIKLVLLTLIIGFVSLTAQAQTEAGSILVGAASDLGFISSKHKDADDATNNFFLESSVGYFVIDDLAVGIGLGIDNTSVGDQSDNTLVFGLLGRYYINSAIIVGANYSLVNRKIDDGTREVEIKGSQFGVEAGYAYFLGDNVAIEPTLSYAIGLGDDLEDINTLSINVGFSLFF